MDGVSVTNAKFSRALLLCYRFHCQSVLGPEVRAIKLIDALLITKIDGLSSKRRAA